MTRPKATTATLTATLTAITILAIPPHTWPVLVDACWRVAVWIGLVLALWFVVAWVVVRTRGAGT